MAIKPERTRTIATFAPREIGDTVMATPLYQALRHRFSNAHFTLISELVPHPVLAGFDIFDDIVSYSPKVNLGRYHRLVLPAFCGDLSVKSHFDQNEAVLSLTRLYAKQRQGWQHKLLGQYTHLLFYKHQVEMNMELAYRAGYRGEIPPPYCPQGDSNFYEHWQGQIGLFINTPMNGFQALPSRQWPLGYWKTLIDLLGAKRVVLVGGTDDQPNMARLASETGVSIEVTSSLAHFTALCQNLGVLVTTDGGGMHIAATTGVPIVSLHGTSSPILLHPWIYPNGRCIAILSPNSCSPCQRSYRERLAELGLTKITCMQNLRPEVVVEATEKVKFLTPGTCKILKGKRLYTKESYLKDFKRQAQFGVHYNASRLLLKFVRS